MLRELDALSRRLRAQDVLVPEGYQPRTPTWIIEVEVDGKGRLVNDQPYRPQEIRPLLAPKQRRSGQIGPGNLKTDLLFDDARYVLGIADPGQERQAALAHDGFVALVERAHAETQDADVSADLGAILQFLKQPLDEAIRTKIQPRDLVTFVCRGDVFPFQEPAVRDFWAAYLATEYLVEAEAACGICGTFGRMLRTLPTGLSELGQGCQLTSFNQGAFRSYGRLQTTNAPLCYPCASRAIGALKHLLSDLRYHVWVARDDSRGARSQPLRNQVAVFWIKESAAIDAGGVEIDPQVALAAILRGDVEDRSAVQFSPAPELTQLGDLLRIPWTAHEAATLRDPAGFCLAILSANKARLVVREWISTSLDAVVGHLQAFMLASTITAPEGTAPRPFSIPVLLDAARPSSPNILRGLLRTAYLGTPPPEALLDAAVQRFRIPETLRPKQPGPKTHRDLHALAATIKLVLTHRKEGEAAMATLDERRAAPAYLCGRLLALLEEAQRRASSGRINASLVDRFYGAASATPGATLSQLLIRAQSSHLAKIRRENRGFIILDQALTDILGQLDRAGGFPRRLSIHEQGEFALGFYQQRAAFQAARPHHGASTQAPSTGGTP